MATLPYCVNLVIGFPEGIGFVVSELLLMFIFTTVPKNPVFLSINNGSLPWRYRSFLNCLNAVWMRPVMGASTCLGRFSKMVGTVFMTVFTLLLQFVRSIMKRMHALGGNPYGPQ